MPQKHTLFLIICFAITPYNCQAMKRYPIDKVDSGVCDYPYPDANAAINIEKYTKEFKSALNAHITFKQYHLLNDNDIQIYRVSQLHFMEKQIQEINNRLKIIG